MAVIDSGNDAAGKANVTTGHELRTIGPNTRTPDGGDPMYDGGFATLVAEIDAGSVTGSPYQRAADMSDGYRLRVGVDQISFFDQFAGSAINTSLWTQVASVSTITVANGYLNLNAGNAVASTNVCRVQTYRTFPIFGEFGLQGEWVGVYTASSAQINSVVEAGFFLASGTTAPTDGAFFRWAANGEFWCVISFNGVETAVQPTRAPTYNERHHFLISMGNDAVEFWIDDLLYCDIDVPAGSPAATATNNLPLAFRNANTGIVPNPVQYRVSQVAVTISDMAGTKTWAETMVGMGLGAYQGPTGQTQGGTSNYAVSAAPATGVLGNTTPSYTTLGGQWRFAAPVAAETDFPVFGYTIPAGTAAIPGKNLIVTGVRISSINEVVAVAGTPTVFQWAVGVGNTAASLATLTEGAAIKLRRVLALGLQSWAVGAAVGAQGQDIDVHFDSPLMCEPGTFFHIMMKPIMGTATATETFRGTCMVNGYWE
jgi:hypothetical protein